MTAWIGVLRAEDAPRIWSRCKEEGLWGSGSNAAGGAWPGDHLFIWVARGGWLAHCMIVGTPKHGREYPDPWTGFQWVSKMRVLTQLEAPHPSPGNPEPLSGLNTVRMGQFPQVRNKTSISRLITLFEAGESGR